MCVNIYEHDPAKPISTLGLARQVALTLFRMGFFGTTHGNKIRHTYPTMIKLGTVIPYLRKIQKCMNHVTHSLIPADISI